MHEPPDIRVRAAGDFILYQHLLALRAKQLQAAPGAELATTWSESARIQSSFFHVNEHAKRLNMLALHDGQEAAARELLARAGQMLADFAEFRIAVFGGEEI